MEAVPAILVVLVAGLACPAIMWWQRRRGRDAACCLPARGDAGDEFAELRRANAALSARLAELQR
ncbi:MAG: hypothetical protein GEU88_08290 [Solirubrobacterales bacterium]|nr:hypothetical protein [Solirubrobacterales bacterium]